MLPLPESQFRASLALQAAKGSLELGKDGPGVSEAELPFSRRLKEFVGMDARTAHEQVPL